MRHLYFIAFFLFLRLGTISGTNLVWTWNCEKGACQKKLRSNITTPVNLAACRLSCAEFATLWPKPTGYVSVGYYLEKLNINSIEFEGIKSDTPISDLSYAIARIFKEGVQSLIPNKVHAAGGKSLIINMNIVSPNIFKLTLDIDESYTLKVFETSDGKLGALITAPTIFGARHGLETLKQLVIFDDFTGELKLPRDVTITDKPVYPYRGILLDTSTNYITVDTIKKTLRGMAASKLNTFHWHITDSRSFPFVSKSHPELFQIGAYAPSKVYTPADIAEIIKYGRERGIRVMPEFDAPAHVGEGWQNTNFLTCFNWQPWQKYCNSPPCGQFDPTQPALYDMLEGIYGDLMNQFQPDVFHMGGDSVSLNCWNNTAKIVAWMAKEKGWGRKKRDFMMLWDHFQKHALERLYKKAGYQIPVIMWSSELTEKPHVLDFLPKERYIIQMFTKKDDAQIINLLEHDYKIIVSNYDALYLDCGFAGWTTDGDNWCTPYIGWQEVYENKLVKIAGERKNQILGGEAVLWTEQVGSGTVDNRLWPRAAAMAETLWTEPSTSWEEAEHRFLVQRERLVHLGINADAVEPEWCLQNEENCRKGSVFNTEHKMLL